ncbi:hypothetical protein JCM3765_001162 [Sporobolomyces pararoseus]
MARTKVSTIPQPTSEVFEKVIQLLNIPPASTDSMRRWLPVVLWKMAHEWLNRCDEKEGSKAPEIPEFPSNVAAVPISRARVSVPIFVSLSRSPESPLDKSQPPSSPSILEQADLELLQTAMVRTKMAVDDVGKPDRISQEPQGLPLEQANVKAEQASERGKRYEARTKMNAVPVTKTKRGKRTGNQTPEVGQGEGGTKSTVDASAEAGSLLRPVTVQADLELVPSSRFPTPEIELDENNPNEVQPRPSTSGVSLHTSVEGQHIESRVRSRSPSHSTTVEAFLSGFPLKVAQTSPSSELSDLQESQQGEAAKLESSEHTTNKNEIEQSPPIPRNRSRRKIVPIRRSTAARPRPSAPSSGSSRPPSDLIPPRQQPEQQEVPHRVTRAQKLVPSPFSSSVPPLPKRRRLENSSILLVQPQEMQDFDDASEPSSPSSTAAFDEPTFEIVARIDPASPFLPTGFGNSSFDVPRLEKTRDSRLYPLF